MVDDWDYECIKNELAEARKQIAATQEYATQARLRENKAEDARVHLSFELEKARVQIAAKDAALREVREHLFDIAHHPNSPIIAKIDAALAAPTQEKSK